jgi:hypothetical protein
MNEQLEEYIVWVLNALAMEMVEIFLEICCSIAGSLKFLVAWGNSPANNTRPRLEHHLRINRPIFFGCSKLI